MKKLTTSLLIILGLQLSAQDNPVSVGKQLIASQVDHEEVKGSSEQAKVEHIMSQVPLKQIGVSPIGSYCIVTESYFEKTFKGIYKTQDEHNGDFIKLFDNESPNYWINFPKDRLNGDAVFKILSFHNRKPVKVLVKRNEVLIIKSLQGKIPVDFDF